MNKEEFRKIVNEIDTDLQTMVRNWLENSKIDFVSDFEIDSLITGIEIRIQDAICHD